MRPTKIQTDLLENTVVLL